MKIIISITTYYETQSPIPMHNIHWQTHRHVNSQEVTSDVRSTSAFKMCNKRKISMLKLCARIWYSPSLHSKLLTYKNVLTKFLYICIIYLRTKFHMTISNGSSVITIKPKAKHKFPCECHNLVSHSAERKHSLSCLFIQYLLLHKVSGSHIKWCSSQPYPLCLRSMCRHIVGARLLLAVN